MQLYPKRETIEFLILTRSITGLEAENGRRALLVLADLEDIQFKTDFSISIFSFCPLFVKELEQYGQLPNGKYAIESLLEEVGRSLGKDKKQKCEELIGKWRVWLQSESISISSGERDNASGRAPHSIQPHNPEQKLFDSFLDLDFEDQVSQVFNSIQLHPVAAFLIHGKENCGQEVLLTRLRRLFPSWKSIDPAKIEVSSNSVGGAITEVWAQTASRFGQDTAVDDLPGQVVERIFECWQTQHVFFIFKGVNQTPVGFLNRLIEEFWQKIVDRVNQERNLLTSGVVDQSTEQKYYLIMFLVDNGDSGIPLSWEFYQSDYPKVPLLLPPTGRFPQNQLERWVINAIEKGVVPENLNLTTRILLEGSDDGIPHLVYKKVCDYCGFSWEGGLIKWLI